jgi:hypothetical protein
MAVQQALHCRTRASAQVNLDPLDAGMKEQHQVTPIELATRDKRPVQEWAAAIKKLIPKLYPRDAATARELEEAIERLAGDAASLDCIGTDDPTAPEIGAATDRVTEYLFRRWPERGHHLGKALARADQVLGRREFLNTITPAPNSRLQPTKPEPRSQ